MDPEIYPALSDATSSAEPEVDLQKQKWFRLQRNQPWLVYSKLGVPEKFTWFSLVSTVPQLMAQSFPKLSLAP